MTAPGAAAWRSSRHTGWTQNLQTPLRRFLRTETGGAAVLLAASAWLFYAGVLHAAGQTFIWIVVFFFASAGASAGYLTVSEIFPIEIRAEALAVFFAIAQVVGAVGPAFYGVLIGNGTSRTGLAIGYVVGGGIMIIGGLVEIVFGIDAEGKPLEQIAAPLTEVDD